MTNPILWPIIMASAASLLYASSDGFVRAVIEDVSPSTATFMSITVNMLLLWTLTIITTKVSFDFWSWRYFVLCGLMAPVFGRLLKYRAIERLGLNLTSPIVSGYPFVSVALAVLILKERLPLIGFIAIILIIYGGILVVSTTENGKKSYKKIHFLLPVLSSLAYGTSQVFRKQGIDLVPYPFLAGAVTATTSWLVMSPIFMANHPDHKIRASNRQLVFISCAGACSTFAMTLLYISYMIGSVVIVAPFANIAPLFTLMITRIFFVREEVFSFHVISGTLLIVAGVILLNVMKY